MDYEPDEHDRAAVGYCAGRMWGELKERLSSDPACVPAQVLQRYIEQLAAQAEWGPLEALADIWAIRQSEIEERTAELEAIDHARRPA